MSESLESAIPWSRHVAEQHVAEWNALVERVRRIVQETANLSPDYQLGPDTALFGRGLGQDSIQALDLSLYVELEFDVRVDSGDVGALGSINSIVERLFHQRTLIS